MLKQKFIYLLLGLIFSFSSAIAKTPTIAILQTVEHPALDKTRNGIIETLQTKNKDMKIIFESAQGDVNLAFQIAQKFLNQKVDVIVTIGTTASQAFQKLTQNNPIPIVFSSVTDPLGAKLVKDLNKPGTNFTGVSNFVPIKSQLEMFIKAKPNLKRLGIIYNPGEANSVKLLSLIEEEAKKINIKIISSAVNKPIDAISATYNLSRKVEAIFITNDNTALSAFKSIAKAANDSKVPVFCSDIDTLDLGATMVLGPNQYSLGQQTAEVVIEIMNNSNPKDIPVRFPKTMELQVNLKNASKIGFSIPQEIINQAQRIIK